MDVQLGVPSAAARAQQELFAYWASRRSGGRLPSRASIHPADFKRLLPTISLIDVLRPQGADADGGAADYRLRLAGTGLYGVYGREITGRTLSDVYNAAAGDYWRSELDKVVATRKPGVGVHNLSWRGASHLQILWMRLPLARDGERVDMILGYDVVMGRNADHTPASGIRAA